jgi:hypothetical protein
MTLMQAYELIIDSKVKTSPFAIVSVDDFQVHTGQPLDPHIILEQANFSLYCIDHVNQRAIFVETSPEVDLLQAPFYFIAQYEAAQRLIAVPFETLHALAREVEIDPQQIILFYSTGRCGSTLFSQVMNLNPSVVSFSEPDVFSQLVMVRTAGQSGDDEIASLLWDSVMVMSANAQQQGFRYYAFKFRSYVLSVSDLLYRSMPKAKILFMYRNALTWAYSFSRAFGAPDDASLYDRLVKYGFRFMIPSVNDHLKMHTHISWVEYVAHMWVSTMQDTRWLQQQGVALASARFEDLKATPQAVIEPLLTHCGLPMPDPDLLAGVLARDSQAGTEGAQDKKEPARRLTDADLTELDRVICELDPELAPDTIL